MVNFALNSRTPLAIVGASARSAAASAVRAGFQPVTADLYADADLRDFASSTRIAPYPDGFLDWLRTVNPPAWMYTGAMENHPELIDQMAWIAPLWGNPGEVLLEVRDPFTLGAALLEAGHRFPETRISPDKLPRDGTWLTKTYRGASGSGVEAWKNGNLRSENSQRHVYQQRIEGEPCAAVFVAYEDSAVLLEITKQLIHVPWLRSKEFQYAGTIAPFEVTESARAEIEAIGGTLAERFALLGLFGVDLIIEGDEVCTLEVNPRYTASVEVVERATGLNAIAAHSAACCGMPADHIRQSTVYNPHSTIRFSVHGKAIMYADRSVTVDESFFAWALSESKGKTWPNVADISPIGTTIAPGRPIVTVFAEADDVANVESCLQDRVLEIGHRLHVM